MPENPTPATKIESEATPGEFNFAKPTEENPRIKRRSLKPKPGGLIKPSSPTPSAARELEREAPPLSPQQVEAKAQVVEAAKVKAASSPVAPPRTTPAMAPAATTSQPVAASTVPKTVTAPAPTISQATSLSAVAKTTPAPESTTTSAATSSPAPTSTTSPSIRSTATPTTSPHGTRPATLYYSSSQPRKDTEAPPMKTIPTASPASSSSSATAVATTTVRPTPTSSTARPASTVDYRANVERQSREQKSVGSILSYVVYGLIAFFVISAGLAIYGADVIFKQLHDQSLTVSDLDARYAAADKDLNAKLASTQDTLTAAQAQIARQQDVILHQQEDINKLIAATTDNANAVKAEKAARAQETANLRARVRDLEERPTTQKY